MPNFAYRLFVLASRLFFIDAQPFGYFRNNRLIDIKQPAFLCYKVPYLCASTSELSRDGDNHFIFRRYPLW